jgi:hypothetical protein
MCTANVLDFAWFADKGSYNMILIKLLEGKKLLTRFLIIIKKNHHLERQH